MQISIPIPMFEEIPAGAYVVGGILAYYWITGVIIRVWIWPRSKVTTTDESESRFFLWACSPMLIMIAVVGLTVWMLFTVLSGGLVAPPWKLRSK